ncbi:activating transcription factor 7 interacting protein 2 isoform X2 [Vanacampus margaritifer]
MKRLCEPSVSESCEKKIKFSQPELRILVEEEVQKAVKKNNTKLQVLAETIQQLQHDLDYEGSVQKLETRIEKISKRAEKVLTAVKSNKKLQSLLPSVVIDDEVIIIDCDDETVPQKINMSRTKNRQENENDVLVTIKNTLKELNNKKQGLSAIMSNLEEICKLRSPPTPVSEPQSPHQNEESVSLCHSNDPQHTTPQQNEPGYPPLPINPFPSDLTMEAVSDSIPPKVSVHLALIEQTGSLSVMWKGEENEISLPPMENYSVFQTMEKVKGSGDFPEWRLLGSVVAKSLPMWIAISKYKPGHKLCVAVVGKDIYGRYGPYSDVVAAVLPE